MSRLTITLCYINHLLAITMYTNMRHMFRPHRHILHEITKPLYFFSCLIKLININSIMNLKYLSDLTMAFQWSSSRLLLMPFLWNLSHSSEYVLNIHAIIKKLDQRIVEHVLAFEPRYLGLICFFQDGKSHHLR